MPSLPRPIRFACLPLLLAGCLPLVEKAERVFRSPAPRSLAFSPDGSVLAVGLTLRTSSETTGGIRFLDATTLRPLAEHRLNYEVTDLRYSRDGKLLFLRGQRIIWQGGIPPGVGQEIGWFDPARGTCPEQPDVDWNGKQTLVCSGDGRAMAWMPEGERTVKVQPLFPEKGPSRSVAVPIKEKVGKGLALATEHGPLAFADADNRIHVLDPGTGKELAYLGTWKEHPYLRGHEQPIRALLLTADGKWLISAAGDDFRKPMEVIVWDVPGQRVHKRLSDLSGLFNRFFLSADGRYLAVEVHAVSESTDLTVWDVERGEKVHTSTHLAFGTPAAFSPDGRRLAVVEYSGAVRILDLPRREACNAGSNGDASR